MKTNNYEKRYCDNVAPKQVRAIMYNSFEAVLNSQQNICYIMDGHKLSNGVIKQMFSKKPLFTNNSIFFYSLTDRPTDEVDIVNLYKSQFHLNIPNALY